MRKPDRCIFCGISDTATILAQNEHALLILDAYPVTRLHALVIPRRHLTDYFELNLDELFACNELLKKAKGLFKPGAQL